MPKMKNCQSGAAWKLKGETFQSTGLSYTSNISVLSHDSATWGEKLLIFFLKAYRWQKHAPLSYSLQYRVVLFLTCQQTVNICSMKSNITLFFAGMLRGSFGERIISRFAFSLQNVIVSSESNRTSNDSWSGLMNPDPEPLNDLKINSWSEVKL